MEMPLASEGVGIVGNTRENRDNGSFVVGPDTKSAKIAKGAVGLSIFLLDLCGLRGENRIRSDKRELYNLRDDLGEKTNLIDMMPDRARELENRLNAWLKAVNAPIPQKK